MANLTFCRQDLEHSPFTVGNTRKNAMLRNVSQSIFSRKVITAAPLRKVVVESACLYTSIYVIDTKRRTTRFKVRKALNCKFVCVFITCTVYRNLMLIKFTTSIIVCQENRSWSKGLRKPFGKINSIHQNDSIVATCAHAVATKMEKHPKWKLRHFYPEPLDCCKQKYKLIVGPRYFQVFRIQVKETDLQFVWIFFHAISFLLADDGKRQ